MERVKKKYSLLYVDDEESNLRIFKDTFRRRFNVFTAISAREGINILETQKIDLILSDQRMPGMTGVEFLKYTLEKYPYPNRILITGYSDTEAIENAINKAHIFQYIRKPWEEDVLERVIENALRIYELERESVKQKKELAEALKKAEESDRLKTEFLNNLSHEIRTPLNAILGFSDFLDEPELTDENRKLYIGIIKKSGEQLLRIINLIIEISSLETGQVTIYNDTVNINMMLDDLYDKFKKLAGEKGLEFVVLKELSEQEVEFVTDKDKIELVLTHLLDNAFKYTEKGKVELGYYVEDGFIIFYVKDTGPGINPDNVEAIFRKFSQENKRTIKDSGGIGLGLSVSKGYVELLKGNILVESREGKGTTFKVRLPFVKE